MAEHELRPGVTVTFVTEVDLSQVESIRARCGQSRPTYTAFMAKAVALALQKYPYANRRVVHRWWKPWAPKTLQRFDNIDVAVAGEREEPGAEACAFVDVMRSVDNRSLDDISKWLRAMAVCDIQSNEQWRSFRTVVTKLPPWIAAHLIRFPLYFPSAWVKYRGAAAVISSPAKYGVDQVATTWPWPIGVSFGMVKPRAVAVGGRVEVRTTTHLMLNFDRRVMAGAQSARFFAHMVHVLENAEHEMADAIPTMTGRLAGAA